LAFNSSMCVGLGRDVSVLYVGQLR
jgi:hypothetical protein